MLLQEPSFLQGLEGSSSILVNPDSAEIEPDVILVRLGERQAVKYHLEDEVILQSWFAPSYLNLTSAVLRDFGSGYVAVLNHDTVLFWDGKESKLEQVKDQVKVSGKIIHLVTNPLDGSVAAIFEDGTAQSLRYLKENLTSEAQETGPLEQGSSPCQSWISLVKNRCYLSHKYASGSGKKKGFKLSTYRLDVDPQTHKIVTAPEPVAEFTPDEAILPFSVLPSLDPPQIVQIDSEGLLSTRTLLGGHLETVCRIPDLSIRNDVLFGSLEAGYLTLLGERRDGEGSFLVLVSLLFSSVLQTLPLKAVFREKSAHNVLPGHGQRVFIKHGKRVSQVQAQGLPRSLAGMMDLQERLAKTEGESLPEKEFKNLAVDDLEILGDISDVAKLYDRIPKVIRDDDLVGLEKILASHPEDIPEPLILQILQFLFTLPDEKFNFPSPTKSHKKNKVSKADSNSCVHREKLLSKVFGISITDEIMSEHLGQIDLKTTLKMIQFLTLSLRLEPGQHTESFLQTVQWLGLVINANYATILVTKDEATIELLAEAQDVMEQFDERSALDSALMPLVNLVKEGKSSAVRPSYANNAYCIEVLDL